MNWLLEISGLYFPPEWTKAALVLALISVWMMIALFAYLNRRTRKPYFSTWTAAWMFYSVHLAASIGLEESPDAPLLVMARRACLGISALFLFWGSFQLTNRQRSNRELSEAVILILIWSYVAAFKVRDPIWITAPVFFLLAMSGIYAGYVYLRERHRYQGAVILGGGLMLWGLHLLAFPFVVSIPALLTLGYLLSTVLALAMSVGMVVEQETTVSEQDYRALFESANTGIFLLEPGTLRILETNSTAQKLTGLSAPELVNLDFRELSPAFSEPVGGEVFDGEIQVLRCDGPKALCQTTVALVHCPRGPVLQLSARDITRRRHAEEALHETNTKLESTLIELRQAQQQMVKQERLSALEQMASGIVHDFNNVLARILGMNELLLTTPAHLNNPESVKKYLQMSNASIEDAAATLRQLREFYRVRQDSETYTPVQLRDVIAEAVAMTQPKWKDLMLARGLDVVVDVDLPQLPTVRARASELREVMANLIFNAAEAMPRGGTIRFRGRCEKEFAVLEISDTGTGMSEDVLSHCLEPFFTTKGNRRTGLGLAIVYGIVQRHVGRIDIQSQPDHGTTVTIRLPVDTETKRPAATEAPSTHNSGKPMRILVVEDEPFLCEMTADYLSADGHSVERATDGRDALEKFHAGQFDLVITDRSMPQMSGDQLTATIKQTSQTTPVIMLTGFGNEEDSTKTPDAPDLILSKPITRASLQEAVAHVAANGMN